MKIMQPLTMKAANRKALPTVNPTAKESSVTVDAAAAGAAAEVAAEVNAMAMARAKLKLGWKAM